MDGGGTLCPTRPVLAHTPEVSGHVPSGPDFPVRRHLRTPHLREPSPSLDPAGPPLPPVSAGSSPVVPLGTGTHTRRGPASALGLGAFTVTSAERTVTPDGETTTGSSASEATSGRSSANRATLSNRSSRAATSTAPPLGSRTAAARPAPNAPVWPRRCPSTAGCGGPGHRAGRSPGRPARTTPAARSGDAPRTRPRPLPRPAPSAARRPDPDRPTVPSGWPTPGAARSRRRGRGVGHRARGGAGRAVPAP